MDNAVIEVRVYEEGKQDTTGRGLGVKLSNEPENIRKRLVMGLLKSVLFEVLGPEYILEVDYRQGRGLPGDSEAWKG